MAANDRPAWVQAPRYDLPLAPDGLPLGWPWWTAEERYEYTQAVAFDSPPGYSPPLIPADTPPVTD